MALLGTSQVPAQSVEIATVALTTGTASGASGAQDKVWVRLCSPNLSDCNSPSDAFVLGDLEAGITKTNYLAPLTAAQYDPHWVSIQFERHNWDNWQLAGVRVHTPHGDFCPPAKALPTWFEGDGTTNLPLHACS
ncbi:hypothetical protein LX83_004807 [Goodfellowiella coeruleoviolacea]|uniref:Uncharacterized protein n=1 Tax=Goodfellowiella coeruleoviolacea TaxID=334858 RepID=A0AAE3KMR9_9PSEU|nr:hypothetical protein [Goodfellowiella coeruleoviolacea]